MMKRKWIAPMVALLLCVSMIGVGFAAWVITSQDETSSVGKFIVHEVKNKTIDISSTLTDANIDFGAAQKAAGVNGTWLSFENNAVTEDLAITLAITITNWNTITADTDNKVTLSIGEGDKAVVITETDFTNADALGKAYITAPTNGEVKIGYADGAWKVTSQPATDAGWKSVALADNGDGTATVTITLNFAWGAAFGNKNPINYYNNGTYEELGEHAATALAELKNLETTEDSAYRITILASVS